MKASHRIVAVTAAAALSFGLAACSGDNSDADGTPACADLWVDGNTLPEGYEGCLDGDSIVAVVTVDCKDGTKFTTYDDRFYATIGDTIHANKGEAAADPAYAQAYNDCRG